MHIRSFISLKKNLLLYLGRWVDEGGAQEDKPVRKIKDYQIATSYSLWGRFTI